MGRHLLIWALLLLLTPVIVPFLVRPSAMLASVTADYNAALSQFGDKPGMDRLVTRIYGGHLKWVGEFAASFKASNDDSEALKESGDRLSVFVADVPGDWADTLRYYVYGIALRLTLLWYWLKWLSVPVLMALAAGKLERDLKQATFIAPVPALNNIASHLSLACVSLMPLWAMAGDWVSFYLAPCILVFLSLALNRAIAHYP